MKDHKIDVRKVRLSSGLSNKELARLLFVHPVTLYRWQSIHNVLSEIDPLRVLVMQALLRMFSQSYRSSEWRTEFAEKLRQRIKDDPQRALYEILAEVYQENV